MQPIQLLAHDIFDPQLEAHYALRTAFRDITTQPHWHDFYELFLIADGSIVHQINGDSMPLTAGAFVFIRPDDTHYYQAYEDAECQLINLAFVSPVFETMIAFLGQGFDSAGLLEAKNPPTVQLNKSGLDTVRHQLANYHQIQMAANERSGLALRTLLVDLFVRYFSGQERQPIELPDWLQEVCRAMQTPQNLAMGLPQMQKIAACSHEHLCRVFKKYLDVTPTQYINDLRLDYAANLLSHSDMEVVDIALEVGFDSLSYFYRRFKTRFGQTPKDYRGSNQRLSPIDGF